MLPITSDLMTAESTLAMDKLDETTVLSKTIIIIFNLVHVCCESLPVADF